MEAGPEIEVQIELDLLQTAYFRLQTSISILKVVNPLAIHDLAKEPG